MYGAKIIEKDGKNMITNPYPHLRIIGSMYIPPNSKGKGITFDLTQGKQPFFTINVDDNYANSKIMERFQISVNNNKAILFLKTQDIKQNNIGFTVTYGEY